ncbi:MAG: acyl--CoA ligase, partial [Streptosporangiales bacterium]|nr:acyl--CoA ligase [Streptosporangiales bacterium]
MTTAPAPATLPDLLRHRVQAAPGETAIVCDDASATYAGLQAASRDVARHLMAGGVGKGDRVGLIMPNGIDWAVVALAVARSGAVLVPLSTLLRPPELRAHLAAADVTTLITVPSYRNRDYPG